MLLNCEKCGRSLIVMHPMVNGVVRCLEIACKICTHENKFPLSREPVKEGVQKHRGFRAGWGHRYISATLEG